MIIIFNDYDVANGSLDIPLDERKEEKNEK